jgi:hypothetical protein
MKIIITFISLMLNTLVLSSEYYAVVKKIRGVAKVENQELKVGDRIEVGQTIYARGKGNFIDIEILPEGSAIRIVNGEMKVDKITEDFSVYSVIFGKVFSYFNKDKDKKITINTSQASFAVRGTKFLAQQMKDKSFLCVCEGVVRASNKTDKYVDVVAGNEVYINSGDDDFVNSVKERDMAKLNKVFSQMGYPSK